MSHELRTPLNVILGYGDLLLLEDFGPLADDQREALERMRGSALELLELIQATLDLSRLEAGKAALHLEDVDLAMWMQEVDSETASLRASKPGIRVAWHAPPAATRAHTDHVKLKVILKNLFANALKFTDDGEVEVRVAVTRQVIEIVVRDTGIGMTPEVRAVIFDAFRQGDASMTRQYGGVGLGLYITSRLVDALGGRIDVDSTPGRGSTFRVRVPADARLARRTGAGLRERRASVIPPRGARG
jgi:signal transduction histidine kinase